MNYHKRLAKRIHELLTFLRAAFITNKSMLKDINEEFEDTLIYQMKLIPKTWIVGFYESVEMFIDIAKSMNPHSLLAAVTKHQKSRLWFDINTYDIFMTNCVKNQINDGDIVAAVENVTQQLRPVCTLIDYLFKYPHTILTNICDYIDIDDDNCDILN